MAHLSPPPSPQRIYKDYISRRSADDYHQIDSTSSVGGSSDQFINPFYNNLDRKIVDPCKAFPRIDFKVINSNVMNHFADLFLLRNPFLYGADANLLWPSLILSCAPRAGCANQATTESPVKSEPEEIGNKMILSYTNPYSLLL